MSALERAQESLELIEWDWSSADYVQLRPLITNTLAALEEQAEGLRNLRELMAMRATQSSSAGMSRADALKAAREHVEAMSTNGRGYQDGVKLADKVAAVDRFARFLMGESE